MVATLGYWKLRGLGQSIKFLLEYTGTEYKEKQYEFGPAPDYDGSQWSNKKFSLGMDFPNLPYYFDGDYKITQSHAIIKYIARQHNLIGSSEGEKVLVEMAEHEAEDLRAAWGKLVYSSKTDFENSKEPYRTDILAPKLESFSKFLGSRKWFAGENLTYVDFLLYELFYIHRVLFPSSLDDFDNLREFITQFESLGPIEQYINSPRYVKTPLNGPRAAYGGS